MIQINFPRLWHLRRKNRTRPEERLAYEIEKGQNFSSNHKVLLAEKCNRTFSSSWLHNSPNTSVLSVYKEAAIASGKDDLKPLAM